MPREDAKRNHGCRIGGGTSPPPLLPHLASAFTVTVGAKRSSARYYLNNVDDVHSLLADLVRGPGDGPFVTPGLGATPARSPTVLTPQAD